MNRAEEKTLALLLGRCGFSDRTTAATQSVRQDYAQGIAEASRVNDFCIVTGGRITSTIQFETTGMYELLCSVNRNVS